MGAREEYEARKAADEARRKKQSEPHKKEPWWFNQALPIDRFTGWLMIYTLVMAIATLLSAAILFKTDHTLKETMVFGQRAYVGINVMAGLRMTPQTVSFTYENFGQTPAKEVRVSSNWEFVEPGGNLPRDFTFPEKSGCNSIGFEPGGVTIFPRNPVTTFSNYCPSDYQNLLLAEQGKMRGFYYGHISYVDIFDKPRRSNFCVIYGPGGGAGCDRHNEIDPDEKH
jgi:hypothetical protein